MASDGALPPPAFTLGLGSAGGTETDDASPVLSAHRPYRRSSTRHRRRATPWPGAFIAQGEEETKTEETTPAASAPSTLAPAVDSLFASLVCPLTGQPPMDPVTVIDDGQVCRP